MLLYSYSNAMWSYHYSEMSSHLKETLVISKRVITTNLNIEMVQFGVYLKLLRYTIRYDHQRGTQKLFWPCFLFWLLSVTHLQHSCGHYRAENSARIWSCSLKFVTGWKISNISDWFFVSVSVFEPKNVGKYNIHLKLMGVSHRHLSK